MGDPKAARAVWEAHVKARAYGNLPVSLITRHSISASPNVFISPIHFTIRAASILSIALLPFVWSHATFFSAVGAVLVNNKVHLNVAVYVSF